MHQFQSSLLAESEEFKHNELSRAKTLYEEAND